MTAFTAAIAAIFRDPNMAADALWKAGGTGAGVACRVVRRMPDAEVAFGRSAVKIESVLFDVQVSEIAAPAKNDTVTIGSEVWRIDGAPRRDRDRLIWTCEAVTT
jgi:hypothetical protein